ncbi:uncharacterized protein LOC108224065 isoform X2 [Daucus carota subsp. sativus]|uniref:Nuclease associated modular domain-containing protein n=3 Tax=Daucus carota subsp. sativus TaxID=79200 RepID=A0A164Y3C5_DAUCS|nr:PREDICTED: uncharacterized protein LOC108224065 isoform X1 [Daucus carota subsp. sativus]
MLIPDLGLSFAYAPISGVPNTSQFPQMGYMVECSIYQSNTKLLKCGISVIRNMPPSITSFTSFIGGHSYRALTRNFCLRDVWHATQTCEPQFGGKSSEGETKSEEETHFSCFDDFDFEDDPELLRRRRIGLANKGKVPWNKGKKHSAETRALIRERTRAAMRDPKVKEKMAESPRTHSDQTKDRIRSSIRRLWDERFKERMAGEKLFLAWASRIAEAAKLGGSGEEELDWNSYEKIKREIALEQRQRAVDKVTAKEMGRIRSQRKAQAKAEKLIRLAEKRDVQEKANFKGDKKRKTHKKSKEEIEELAVAQELRLKERLIKMHRRKSTAGQLTNQDHRSWEKIDLESVKRDQIHKEVSLADQIRAVKNKRTLTNSSSICLSSQRSDDE